MNVKKMEKDLLEGTPLTEIIKYTFRLLGIKSEWSTF